MFLFNTLTNCCCKHFVAITPALLCLINKCFFDIQMVFLFDVMLVKYINACFNIVGTMTVRCLSGFSCPDYNSCFEELS